MEGEKKAKVGGQVGIHDPDDKLKEALVEIQTTWERVNTPARYSYAAIAKTIILAYRDMLKEAEPKKIDAKRLFDIRE